METENKKYYIVTSIEESKHRKRGVIISNGKSFSESKHLIQNKNITKILEVKTVSFREIEKERKIKSNDLHNKKQEGR